MNQRIARTLGVLSVAGLTVVLATACSSKHTPTAQADASPSSSVDPGSAGAGGGISTGPSAPADSPDPGGTGTPVSRPCTAGDVSIAQIPGGDAAGGTVVVAITLTNKSGHACSVTGYPAFTLAGETGNQAISIQHGGSGIATLSAPVAPVSISPAGKAGFLVVFLNRPTSGDGSCGFATKMSLKVGPGTVTGPVQISTCGSPLKVSPYVPPNKLAAA